MRVFHRLALGIPQVRRLRDARDALLRERDELAARPVAREAPAPDSPCLTPPSTR
jgi:hypothetical protein